jgi:hypothetical protein
MLWTKPTWFLHCYSNESMQKTNQELIKWWFSLLR